MIVIKFCWSWYCPLKVGCWQFYVLATHNVISGWVPTCDSVHSRRVYSAALLGDQAASTRTWYPTQPHYPDTEPTNPFLILIMPSVRLGSNEYQFLSHSFDLTRVWTHRFESYDLPKWEKDAQLIRPSSLVAPLRYLGWGHPGYLPAGKLYSIGWNQPIMGHPWEGGRCGTR